MGTAAMMQSTTHMQSRVVSIIRDPVCCFNHTVPLLWVHLHEALVSCSHLHPGLLACITPHVDHLARTATKGSCITDLPTSEAAGCHRPSLDELMVDRWVPDKAGKTMMLNSGSCG